MHLLEIWMMTYFKKRIMLRIYKDTWWMTFFMKKTSYAFTRNRDDDILQQEEN